MGRNQSMKAHAILFGSLSILASAVACADEAQVLFDGTHVETWDVARDAALQAAILNSGLISAPYQAARKTFSPCTGRVPGPRATTGAPFGGTAPTRVH